MVQFENLVITPKESPNGNPLTVRFTISNNQETDDTIGFIIEHHPPAYLIIDEANTSLKYFQYAKSVPLKDGEHRAYHFTFSSKYVGVNTVVVNYLGHQVLAGESNEPARASDRHHWLRSGHGLHLLTVLLRLADVMIDCIQENVYR